MESKIVGGKYMGWFGVPGLLQPFKNCRFGSILWQFSNWRLKGHGNISQAGFIEIAIQLMGLWTLGCSVQHFFERSEQVK